MPTYDNTLLDQTYKAAVDRQIAYGKERNVPWGVSESGYNAVDVHFNYQYRAFGVPGLGLKRGLGEDLVIAPYASVLALMIAPQAACRNLERLAVEGLAGKFGFYEAVDYTPARLRRGEKRAVIRSFMAHHQGMSLLSLAYALLDRPMQSRFESEPLFQATMLLLQERIPKPVVLLQKAAELPDVRVSKELPEMPIRLLKSANTPIPEVQLLSNGRYHVSYDFCSAALSASAMNARTSAGDGGLASLRAATSTASVRYERTSLVSSFLNRAGEPNTSTVATAPLNATA